MYLVVILATFVVLPAISVFVEVSRRRRRAEPVDLVAIIGRWFVFWAVGVRLLLAGASQVFNPAFTAETVFDMDDSGVYPIVTELGFANLAFGCLGIVSLAIRSWVVPAAFVGAIFFGLDGIRHVADGAPYTSDRLIAMVSDLWAMAVLGVFVVIVARRSHRLKAR